MSQSNVLFEMVNGPVGLGIDKVSQWVDHSDFVDSTQNGRLSLSQTIPAGSFLLGSEIKVEEALAGGDTNTMDIGTAAGGAQILAGATVNAIATVGGPAVTALQYISSAATVHVEINEGTDWDNITAGKFLVTVYYLTTNLELSKGYPKKFRS